MQCSIVRQSRNEANWNFYTELKISKSNSIQTGVNVVQLRKIIYSVNFIKMTGFYA